MFSKAACKDTHCCVLGLLPRGQILGCPSLSLRISGFSVRNGSRFCDTKSQPLKRRKEVTSSSSPGTRLRARALQAEAAWLCGTLGGRSASPSLGLPVTHGAHLGERLPPSPLCEGDWKARLQRQVSRSQPARPLPVTCSRFLGPPPFGHPPTLRPGCWGTRGQRGHGSVQGHIQGPAHPRLQAGPPSLSDHPPGRRYGPISQKTRG